MFIRTLRRGVESLCASRSAIRSSKFGQRCLLSAGALIALLTNSPPALAATPTPAPTQGETVAILDLACPHATDFTLRGTIPIPPNTFPRADGLMPFSVKDSNGAIVPAQVERVTSYANYAQGADVVEIIARVHRPPTVWDGDRIQYEIIDAPHPDTRPALNPLVRAMITTPNALRLTTQDCFGHLYKVDLREGQFGRKGYRNGSEVFTMRYNGMLKPIVAVPGETLPHMLGVQTYISYWAREDVITIDMRVHNGTCNLDKVNPIDDCNDKVYFKELNVLVPPGWTVQQDFADPFFGAPTATPNYVSYPLVMANSDGTMHVMPQQAQMERRLAITPVGNEAKAREFLDERFLGFCVKGTNAQGHQLWSWWNDSTARYFPQHHRLPELDHLGVWNARTKLKNDFLNHLQYMNSGASQNAYPIHSAVLGWAHPWGVDYGGMTSGTEIFMYDGFVGAYCGSNEGYRDMQLRHRMYTDRQPDVLFNKDGNPTSLYDWIIHGPTFDYLPSAYYQGIVGNFDMFGFNLAQMQQVNYVAAHNLEPAYEPELMTYAPIDLQHYVRYLNSPKVLVWQGNDSMAKDDLLMRAEIARLSYHEYPTSGNGLYVTSSMLADINFTNNHPGVGMGYGRGNGWQNDAMLCAYATGTPAWRAQAKPWFDKQVDILRNGQAACTGVIQANESPKLLDGLYRARQSIEQAIIEHSLVGINETVYRGVDPVRLNQLNAVLVSSLYSMIQFPGWSTTLHGPWSVFAVGPLDVNLPLFCTVLPLSQGTDGGADKYQTWSSFGYGFELTGDPLFLQRAFEMAGGQNDLLWELQHDNYTYIENRAAIFADVYTNNYP